jgi:hypothetical protein
MSQAEKKRRKRLVTKVDFEWTCVIIDGSWLQFFEAESFPKCK